MVWFVVLLIAALFFTVTLTTCVRGHGHDDEQKLIQIHASGTTNIALWLTSEFNKMMARANPAVHISYRAVGSGTGQAEFINKIGGFEPLTAFGTGDIPLSQEDMDDLDANQIAVVQAPLCLSAISVFYNIPVLRDADNKELFLTSCLLARIFMGEITSWCDEDIVAVNPDLDDLLCQEGGENDAIFVGHRVLGSSSTSSLTNYLHQSCPEEWPESKVGKEIEWFSGAFGVEGTPGMLDFIRVRPNSIGYLVSGDGHAAKLPEISLRNKDGNYVTSLDPIGVQEAALQAILSGDLPSNPSDSFANVNLVDLPGAKTWPMVAQSYMYIRVKMTEFGEEGPLIAAVLEQLLSEEAQTNLLKYGLIRIPTPIMKLSEDALALLELSDDYPRWKFEWTTVPFFGAEEYTLSIRRQSIINIQLNALDIAVSAVATAISEGGGEASIDFAARIAELEETVGFLTNIIQATSAP